MGLSGDDGKQGFQTDDNKSLMLISWCVHMWKEPFNISCMRILV